MSTITDSTDSFEFPSSSSERESEGSGSLASSPEPVGLVQHLDNLCSTSDLPFNAFCSRTFDYLAHEIPEIAARLERFKANPTNQPMLEKWKNRSWNDLKAAHKEGLVTEEEMHQWHTFRIRAKNEMEEIIKITLAHFNYVPIRWQMVGTPGWSSDIDNSALCDHPNGELSVSLGKLLFDVLWFQAFGELSGVQADLETYTSHAGERETYLKLETDEGRRQYASVAFLGAHIALIRSMDPDEWQTYREEFIETHKKLFGEAVSGIYSQLLDEVETFHNESESEVFREVYISDRIKELSHLSPSIAKRTAENDFEHLDRQELSRLMKEVDTSKRDYKLARYNIKMGKLFKIGCLIDVQDKRIFSLEKQLMEEVDPSIILNIHKRIDACHIEIARLNILRESMQDEGYITQGAYLNVCKHSGSQIDIRGRETVSRQMSIRGFADKPPQRRASHPHELVESILENGAGHFHKLHLHGQNPMAALVESAKYGQRVIEAAQPLIPRERRLSRAQIFLAAQGSGNPAALLLALKRKTLAANMLPALLACGLRKQNERVQKLYDHMHEGKVKAPASNIKQFFYRHLHSFFKKGGESDPHFDQSFDEFFNYHFAKIGDNWEDLQAKLESRFPLHEHIEGTAALIDSEIQSTQEDLGPDFALMPSSDRYRFLLQRIGMKNPLMILNPDYEPFDPFMGAIIGSAASYTQHNFHKAVPEVLEIQKQAIMQSLGIHNPEELPAFMHEMNTSMRTFLIETHAYAISHHRHPIAVPMSLAD